MDEARNYLSRRLKEWMGRAKKLDLQERYDCFEAAVAEIPETFGKRKKIESTRDKFSNLSPSVKI